MRSIIPELNERNFSILKLLEHIKKISETKGNIDVIVVLKSSFFIALYNNIEATIYSVVEEIHSSASGSRYDLLNESLQVKMLKYSFGKSSAALMNDKKKVDEEIQKFRASGEMFPQLENYLKRQNIFSGNIDARKLNVLGISYGLPKLKFPKPDAEKMLWVKNKRNKIAHGEQSMSEAGQGIKTADLECAFSSVDLLLRLFIDAVATYLIAKDYCKR